MIVRISFGNSATAPAEALLLAVGSFAGWARALRRRAEPFLLQPVVFVPRLRRAFRAPLPSAELRSRARALPPRPTSVFSLVCV